MYTFHKASGGTRFSEMKRRFIGLHPNIHEEKIQKSQKTV